MKGVCRSRGKVTLPEEEGERVRKGFVRVDVCRRRRHTVGSSRRTGREERWFD